MSHQERAALVQMGNDMDATRACLAATESRSIRLIASNELQRFTSAGKPQAQPTPTPPTPQPPRRKAKRETKIGAAAKETGLSESDA